MRVQVSKDEYYPFYDIDTTNADTDIILTEKELAYVRRAMKMFYKAQNLLGEQIEAREEAARIRRANAQEQKVRRMFSTQLTNAEVL